MANGVCEQGECSFSCFADCACGDGKCSGSETPESCPSDCKFSNDMGGRCGNGYCDSWEVDKSTKTILCPQDCKVGPEPVGTTCGDGNCSTAETAAACPADCGNPLTSICGNGVCEQGEHWSTCPDCPVKVDQGTFLGAACNGYALVEQYADGNGGVADHTVTSCSASCGAYPWKLVDHPGGLSYNGAVLLKPDCTTCTIVDAPDDYIVGDTAGYGWGWTYIPNQTTYAMALDPNNCGTLTLPYIPSSPWSGYPMPVEWEKTADQDCSLPGGCQVHDCDGAVTTQTFGSVGIWKPAYAPWSILQAYCQ